MEIGRLFRRAFACMCACVGGQRNTGRKGEREREKKRKRERETSIRVKKKKKKKLKPQNENTDLQNSKSMFTTARSARLPVPVAGWQVTLEARTGSLMIRLPRDKWSSSFHLGGFLWQFAIYTLFLYINNINVRQPKKKHDTLSILWLLSKSTNTHTHTHTGITAFAFASPCLQKKWGDGFDLIIRCLSRVEGTVRRVADFWEMCAVETSRLHSDLMEGDGTLLECQRNTFSKFHSNISFQKSHTARFLKITHWYCLKQLSRGNCFLSTALRSLLGWGVTLA